MTGDESGAPNGEALHVRRRRFLKLAGVGAAGAALAAVGLRQCGGESAPVSTGAVTPLEGLDINENARAVEAIRDLKVRSLSEMDRLPWFERNGDGELIVRADLGLPPIVDIHAHVGWRHGVGRAIDMDQTGPVAYLYDFERDQDVLFEQDHPGGTEGRDLTLETLSVLVRTPGRYHTHTAANLEREMDAMNVAHACLLPIEIPVGSHHAADTLEAARRDGRYVPFGGVNPRSWGTEEEDALLEQIEAYGIRGIKYHPVFQFVPPDDPGALAMFEFCAENDLIVLSHIGYTGNELPFMRAASEPERLVKALEANPKLKLVCLHTGVRRIDETLAVARRFPEQVWLGLSGQPTPNISYILRRYDTERILWGSDWPFYPLSVMLARALAATEKQDTIRRRILYENGLKLLDLA